MCFCVFQALNVSTVQDLLGVNLPDLKLFEKSSVVNSWVAQQYQSVLNTLHIGLFGGRIPSVTSQSTIISVTTSQINQTTSANTTVQSKNTVYQTAHFYIKSELTLSLYCFSSLFHYHPHYSVI